MKIIKQIIASAALAALIAPAAYAVTPDCTDDKGGTINPVINLVAEKGCYIYASTVEPSSSAKTKIKLLPADGRTLTESSAASEIVAELDRLAVYFPGYTSRDVDDTLFSDANSLWQITLGSDGVAVLAINELDASLNYGIEDSAYTLQAALGFVNSYRSTNAGQIAVLGYSLGGIVARYALADMEAKNIAHNVALYVSNDAPHRGAYIPQALQQVLPVLQEYQNDLPSLNNSINAFFTTWGVNINFSASLNMLPAAQEAIEAIGSASAMLNSKIGKQLLIDHVAGTTEHNNLMSALATLGYPTQTTNIAITNGSVLGVRQPAPTLNANGAFYEFFGKKGSNVSTAYFGARIALYPTVAGQQNLHSKLSGWVQKKAPCPWPLGFMTCTSTNETSITPKNRTTPSTAKELDRVPGSIVNLSLNEFGIGGTPGQMFRQVTEGVFAPAFEEPPASGVVAIKHINDNYNFPFIPTYSALDIDRPDGDLTDSIASALAEQANNPVYVDGARKLIGISGISSLHFDDIYVNGENLSHLDVSWPESVVEAIKNTVAQ